SRVTTIVVLSRAASSATTFWVRSPSAAFISTQYSRTEMPTPATAPPRRAASAYDAWLSRNERSTSGGPDWVTSSTIRPLRNDHVPDRMGRVARARLGSVG